MTAKRKGGRPLQLTETVTIPGGVRDGKRQADREITRGERIAELVSMGNSREVAAAAVGITAASLYAWLARGRADRREGKRTPFLEFLEAIEKADADDEVMSLARIKSAAGKSWQAAAWHLERKHPERYAQRSRLVIESLAKQEAAEHTVACLADALMEVLDDPQLVQLVLDRFNDRLAEAGSSEEAGRAATA